MKPKPKCPFYDKIFRRPKPATKGLSVQGFSIPPTAAVEGKLTCYKVCGTSTHYHPTCCMNCPKFLSCKLQRQSCIVSKQSRILKLCILKNGKDVNKYRENLMTITKRIRGV
jgi:hypothetical protein